MRLSNTLICHSLASFMLLTVVGCSKKTDDPAVSAVGQKRSREYDIRLRYTGVGLGLQEDAGGASGFNLDTRIYAEGQPIGYPTPAAPTGEIKYQTNGNTTGYVFPVRVQFTSISALRQPVNFNPTVDIHVNVDVVIDGRVVDTIVLNRNTSGFATPYQFGGTPVPVQAVTKDIDLGKY
ncbi:MAG: hypothetical protein JWP58_2073 [Hymenobacter sp.]|nr:hypothetical protein [Hymenobacter sp.]